ncbi:phage protein Gp27 family protein [Nitrospirillum viridazoti]|uniref:Uncharacterized protein DUF3486 n=1 Tax=Nitrospirillum amazonense TaxID=28077 RepID=A0A560II20_9PROT|nr:phage protein Gp27 family protein [Nitrospirillum amazonense]TWB58693.1 uncharacterized protein DUF3486 [Nitrospirillum amazonense]
MARASKVDRLPAEIREAISSLREQGLSIDDILQHLQQLGIRADAMPSRSGLHRHVQGLDALAERLQRSRAVAEALVRKLGDAPESRQARLNIELMHSVVTDLMLAAGEATTEDGGQAVAFDPQQVMFLAKSLDHLAHAQKTDADMTLRIRAEVETKTKAAAVKAAEAVAKQRGLTADTVQAIKAQILNVRVA